MSLANKGEDGSRIEGLVDEGVPPSIPLGSGAKRLDRVL